MIPRRKRRARPTAEELLASPEARHAYESERLLMQIRAVLDALPGTHLERCTAIAEELDVGVGVVAGALSDANRLTISALSKIGAAAGIRFVVTAEPVGDGDTLRRGTGPR